MLRPPGKVGSEDLVLGEALAPLSPWSLSKRRPLVCLNPRDQAYHATIFGRSGLGKSRFLQSLFVQHLLKGHGVCLIEPHHDLSHATMAYLTERGYFRSETAFDQLIYLDWGNGAFVPFNVLAGRGSLHTRAMHTMEAMMRVWPELRRAPTFQTLTLACLVCLCENNLPITLLHRLLVDAPFREQCLTRVSDPLIHSALAGFGKLTSQDTGSARRRAFLLSFHEVSRLTLGQPDLALDIRALMDEGRSLIVNLGNIQDAETRSLIGALLLLQIEQAALSRTDLADHQRRPWTVLLDEWPSFARTDTTIGSILDQTRKFGLRMILAAQNPSQIGSDVLQAALENCRLSVSFGLGRKSAVEQSRDLASLDLTLPAHPQFEALAQDLQHLHPQEAYVRIGTEAPVKMRTLSVADAHPDATELASVLATYKERYQRTREAVEQLTAMKTHSPANTADDVEPFAFFSDAV